MSKSAENKQRWASQAATNPAIAVLSPQKGKQGNNGKVW